ncbi:hypothetical protein GCM10009839_84240 [Catenulispora yoronensis]|uniref:Prevent-host-death family protein n=1 Tax=Catenulispora yoronensis TaxID=450799 RepID=A0ABP5H3P5_9ACTN
MATETFPYSTFLRNPSQVLPALEESKVVILERRGEANLALMYEHAHNGEVSALSLMARSFAALNRRDPELTEEILSEEISWLHWLPAKERPECVKELLADLVAAADTGLIMPFVRDFRAWRATAEVWSDPELAARLSEPIDPAQSLPLERPIPQEPA